MKRNNNYNKKNKVKNSNNNLAIQKDDDLESRMYSVLKRRKPDFQKGFMVFLYERGLLNDAQFLSISLKLKLIEI
jgi:hypothetical protein